ncbi:MAG: hypothetical protein LUC85_07265 [Bacteroidales bacterium]|nr:hypothetical protein [Bacteroidales bacterium]
MNTSTLIIQLLIPLMAWLSPWIVRWRMRHDKRWLLRIKLRLAWQTTARRFVGRLLVAVLFVFLFTYYWMPHSKLGLVLATLLAIWLCREQAVECVLSALTSRSVMLWSFVACLVIGLVPALYPVAVTIMLAVTAAYYYPSKKLVDMVSSPDFFTEVTALGSARRPFPPLSH